MPEDAMQCDSASGGCHLCGDVATLGSVLEMDSRLRIGRVAMNGEVSTVAFDFVDASVGDEVLVHLGFAIERVERGGGP